MKCALERRDLILERVNKDGYMQVSELASLCDVTTATIRTDLNALEREGLLRRAHGTAMSTSHFVKERSNTDKSRINAETKRKIGREALKHISENDTVFIAAGTTVEEFAKQIPVGWHLDVFTPCLNIATMMSSCPNMTIHLLGGVVHRNSMSVRGEYSAEVMATSNCTVMYFGADGIDKDGSISGSTLEEALFMKKVMKGALKIVLLCDSSKIGCRGAGRICDMEQVDVFITDSGLSENDRKNFEAAGTEVIIAE